MWVLYKASKRRPYSLSTGRGKIGEKFSNGEKTKVRQMEESWTKTVQVVQLVKLFRIIGVTEKTHMTKNNMPRKDGSRIEI